MNVDKVLEIIDNGLLGIFVGEMMKQLMTHLLVLEISLALGISVKLHLGGMLRKQVWIHFILEFRI